MRVRVASAGTGKTTSLVLRYLQLVDEGRPLRRIAGVTFTRAAADELRQRVGGGIDEVLAGGTYLGGVFRPVGDAAPFLRARRELDGAVLSTIHGFLIATLRLSAPVLGLDPDFGVLGEWEAAAMFEEEVRSLRLLAADPAHPRHGDAELLGERAPELLMALFGKRSLAPSLAAGDSPQERALLALFQAAYARYQGRLAGALVAPGEVERRALQALDVPQARSRVVARFPVALIDEFQDVNPVQGAFFERLEGAGVQVEVVGDPKQSIYGFRNADVEVFRRALDAAEARGEVLPPLTDSRRHAVAVAAFLNRLTDGLAARSLGFGPREAPRVAPAGPQASRAGRVELHWLVGDERIARLRAREAAVLAEALQRHHAAGVPFDGMAVLARSYGGLTVAEEALRAAGIPCVMLQGRGYYDRNEIRDLYHALRVGIRPEGVSLAAFLRGPFGQLDLAQVDTVMRAERPLEALTAEAPEVTERVEALQRIARLAPLEALKRLVRDRWVGGHRYVDFLDERARQNVDALLFEVAARTPRDLEVLLDRLELLSRQAEAGDVPQSGDGVRLLTVHRSKGLEFALAAVFDAGRMSPARSDPLYLDPRDGQPRVAGSEGYEAARREAQARDEQESYRLLYVAASRARDTLLLTGSVKAGDPQGWASALTAIGLGPAATEGAEPATDLEGVTVHTHPFEEAGASRHRAPEAHQDGLPAAPWLTRRFPRHRYPAVFSPSRLKRGAAAEGAGEPSAEPLPPTDPDVGAGPPGRAAAVGTLVHYAIGQDWDPGDAATAVNLAAQEVMFAFAPDERREVVDEVLGYLRTYRSLLGAALPALSAREDDRSELPVAVPYGGTVWQGVIDRLYRVKGEWTVEDYKTDRSVRPERYAFQLALYAHAVERALGARPRAQLVYLRSGEVVPVDDGALREAFATTTQDEGA
ncbi:MAG: UvrD-helicase domain-containing protein [Deinococcales bacterium]